MLKLSDITVKNIKSGSLEKDLPEFYKLKNVVANSSWHDEDIMFEHSLKVAVGVQKVLSNLPPKLNNKLNETVQNYTKKELLFIAAVFHDIGKLHTGQQEGDTISFPSHEKVGASNIGKILAPATLLPQELDLIKNIIRNHGLLHDLFSKDESNRVEEDYKKIKTKHQDIILELLVLVLSEVQTAKVKQPEPLNRQFRIRFYETKINEL